MKSYSFYLNANDWLASGSVKLMSKAERGCFINLLCIAWGAERSGTLPASEDKVRRLAEMTPEEWAVSGEVLLEVFPVSECGTHRYNKRLMLEVSKEERKSEKARKSADARWGCERNANASKNNANASENLCERNAQVQEQDTTKVVVGSSARTLPLPAKKNRLEMVAAHAVATGGDTFTADTFTALNDPQTFADLLAYLGYSGIDTERYRLDIRGKAKGDGMTALPTSFNRFITSYMSREQAAGPLQPTPAAPRPAIRKMPDNPADLWGGLNPAYDERTYNQTPAGQYGGSPIR